MNVSFPCFTQISFTTTCNLLGLSYPPYPAEMVGRKKCINIIADSAAAGIRTWWKAQLMTNSSRTSICDLRGHIHSQQHKFSSQQQFNHSKDCYHFSTSFPAQPFDAFLNCSVQDFALRSPLEECQCHHSSTCHLNGVYDKTTLQTGL